MLRMLLQLTILFTLIEISCMENFYRRLDFENTKMDYYNGKCKWNNPDVPVIKELMEKAKFPVCFKDFHDQALLRVCGHPKYTHLAYCFNASRVSEAVRGPGPGQDKNFHIIRSGINEKSDSDMAMILLDGCFICSHFDSPVIYEDVNIDLKHTNHLIKPSYYDYGYTIDHMGNFVLAIAFEELTNFYFKIWHRCNQHQFQQHKVIHFGNFSTGTAKMGYKRFKKGSEWISRNIIINLEQGSEHTKEIKFTDLPNKHDREFWS